MKIIKAAFLDRDGVINEEKKLIHKKEDISILPDVIPALKKMKEKGYLLIVVTNQPVIARGFATEKEINELNDFINGKLENLIDKFYICPHHPEMHPDVPQHAIKFRILCECRKPAPGMLLQAAKDFKIDLKNSWMIGDMLSDISAGKNAGVKTILVKSQNNDQIIKTASGFDINIKPDYYAKSLLEAANMI